MSNLLKWIIGILIGIIIGMFIFFLLKKKFPGFPPKSYVLEQTNTTAPTQDNFSNSCDLWYESNNDPNDFPSEFGIESYFSNENYRSKIKIKTEKNQNDSNSFLLKLKLDLDVSDIGKIDHVDYRFIGIPHHPIYLYDHDCAPAIGIIEIYDKRKNESISSNYYTSLADKYAERTYVINIPQGNIPNDVAAIWSFGTESGVHKAGSGTGLRHGKPHPIKPPY